MLWPILLSIPTLGWPTVRIFKRQNSFYFKIFCIKSVQKLVTPQNGWKIQPILFKFWENVLVNMNDINGMEAPASNFDIKSKLFKNLFEILKSFLPLSWHDSLCFLAHSLKIWTNSVDFFIRFEMLYSEMFIQWNDSNYYFCRCLYSSR